MATKEMRNTSLAEMKGRYMGKEETPERDAFEYELKMEVLEKMIRTARKERNLT